MLSCTKIARVYFKHLIGPYGDKREDLFVIRLWILRVRSVQIFWREFFHIKKKKKKRGENFVVQDLLENIKSFFVSCLISIIVDIRIQSFSI